VRSAQFDPDQAPLRPAGLASGSCGYRIDPEDAMSVQQTLLACGGIFLLSFFAIWALWFIERWRGNSAPKIDKLTGEIVKRGRPRA